MRRKTKQWGSCCRKKKSQFYLQFVSSSETLCLIQPHESSNVPSLHFLTTREGENEHHIRGSFLSQAHSGSPAPSTGRREIYQERDNTGSLSGKPWIPGQGQTGSCSCPPGIQKSWKNENRPLVIEELWNGK